MFNKRPVGGTTQSQVFETIRSFPVSVWKSAHFRDFPGVAKELTGATETIPGHFSPATSSVSQVVGKLAPGCVA